MDISSSGQVVGYRVFPAINEAFLWDLTTAGVQTTALGSLDPEGPFSRAWGVNDAQPIGVVGETSVVPPCPDNEQAPLQKAFVWRGDTQTMSALESDGSNGTFSGRAFAIDTPAAGNEFAVAGEFYGCRFEPACPGLASRPGRWTVVGGPFVSQGIVLPWPLGFPDREGEARAVNNNNQFAGWGTDLEATCVTRALVWEPVTGAEGGGGGSTFTVVDLHSNPNLIPGPLPPGQETRAEAINNLALPQIAGWNDTTGRALLWERQSPPPDQIWKIINVTDQLDQCDDWTVRQAFDVNDSGWIVAVAVPQGGAQNHAVLLTPHQECVVFCDEDVSGPFGEPDCFIGVDDFLAIQAAWGPCPDIPAPCREDFTCDGIVNVDEVLAVFAKYNQNCESCPEGASAPPPDSALEEAVWLLGFADLGQYQAWLAEAGDEEAYAVSTVLAGLLEQ